MPKGPWNLVLPRMSMNMFGPCQIVFDRNKSQVPFGINQMFYGHLGQDQMFLQISRTFWHKPNVLWTKCFMGILYKTKYQGPFGVDQMFYGHFGQDQMVFQISRTFWHNPNVSRTKCLMEILYRTKYPARDCHKHTIGKEIPLDSGRDFLYYKIFIKPLWFIRIMLCT